MGLIGTILGNPRMLGKVAEGAADLAEVFTPNATRRMELSAEAQARALEQLAAEYRLPPEGWFDRAINGLNRLPRPLLAFGTIGLFTYAMVDPLAFAHRMAGLNAVPDPLWWLLGAVVAFYFGARETHYFRNRPGPALLPLPVAEASAPPKPDENAALDDWRHLAPEAEAGLPRL